MSVVQAQVGQTADKRRVWIVFSGLMLGMLIAFGLIAKLGPSETQLCEHSGRANQCQQQGHTSAARHNFSWSGADRSFHFHYKFLKRMLLAALEDVVRQNSYLRDLGEDGRGRSGRTSISGNTRD